MNSYEMEKTEVVKKELDRLQNLVIKKVNLYNANLEDIENFNESVYFMMNTLRKILIYPKKDDNFR